MKGGGLWDDLTARLGSSAIIAALGLFAIWLGGPVFVVVVALVCGTLIWELVRILKAGSRMALPLGLIGGGVIVLGILLPPGFAAPFLLAPAMIAIGRLEHNRTLFGVFSVMILVAGWGMIELRGSLGFGWLMWLVLVVIVTDVAGYFAGRTIGGPKFWPKVSPKKTWSGTVAGWFAAALVGIAWVVAAEASLQIVGISIALSMASQLGDIAESAMKRRMGVKDSSGLVPGHGGLFDRFDGMLGAVVFFLLIARIVEFPPVPL